MFVDPYFDVLIPDVDFLLILICIFDPPPMVSGETLAGR